MSISADQVELNSLLMVGNKRTWLNRTNAQFKAGLASMAAAAGLNGVAGTTTATDTGESDAIVNRSPSTTNNNYPVRSDAPWVALIALLVVGGLALAGMLMMSQPKTAIPSTTTAGPANPQGSTASTGKKGDPNYIEFYKP